jgi:hypothetical protein
MMMVEARKTREVQPFTETPQQSDYVVAWNGGTATATGSVTTILKRVEKNLPMSWRSRLRGAYGNWQSSLGNRRFYKKLA